MDTSIDQKRLTSQQLRYLRAVWHEPSIAHTVARAVSEAYARAPSHAQIALREGGKVQFQVVIHPDINALLVQMRIDHRLSSAIKIIDHLMYLAENTFDTPCLTCVSELMLVPNSQRVTAVSGIMTSNQWERWTALRARYADNPLDIPRYANGHTKAACLERLIVEAWVRAYKPPHSHSGSGMRLSQRRNG
jgi:hypothetical protein